MTWLGFDGEGIGRFPHRYVMVGCASSDGTFREYLEDVRGLSTEAVLSWLLKLPAGEKKSRVHVAGYYLSYDWTKILTDLPDRSIYRLLRPELRHRSRDEGGGFDPVHFRGFKLNYLSGMMRIERGERRVTVWDVGKFYQQPFVGALEEAGLAPPAMLARMKAERGTWSEKDLDRMRHYCVDQECPRLAALVELLERQHEALGLDMKTWHGPGSTASALLTKHKVLDCHAKMPPVVDELASRAFFGGRFEQSCIGERDDVQSFDVRSAYPHAATTLPCLKHGKWVHRRKVPKDGAVTLVRYRVRNISDRCWGPLPCRLSDGSICWPRGGFSGWAWGVEFEQAIAGWRGVDYAREHWELVCRCDCQPFGFLPSIFEWRMSAPENKKVGKLAPNSVYGKIAQSIGGGSKWSSRAWAGIITATCRARMLELIRAHSDESQLFAIATDGAYSRERPKLDEGPALGQWEVDDKGRMTFVRPGIYWAHQDILDWYARPGDKSLAEAAAKAVRSRGIGRRHLLTQIVEAERAILEGDSKALLGTTTQFGGARECVYRTASGVYKRSPLYGEWYETPATLSLDPAPKRTPDWRPPMLDEVESAPYKGKSADGKLLQTIGSMLEGRIR